MTFHRLLALATLALLAFGLLGCGPPPEERHPEHAKKAVPCPPPPEPTHQAVVVGTIGKFHMVESRYALTRLGDVLAAFKPDLILAAVRVDAFRDGKLEDASFEMTYVNDVASRRGVPVEPIDWFREEELGAALPAVEPWDVSEVAKRETGVLGRSKLMTFEQANSAELEREILFATIANARHRSGNPNASRRAGWIEHLAGDAVTRHGNPKRVLAYVDVFDRPIVDRMLGAVGYTTRDPSEVLSKSSEVIRSEPSSALVEQYEKELGRARAKLESAKGPARTFWAERVRTLEVVVEHRAACCVSQGVLASP